MRRKNAIAQSEDGRQNAPAAAIDGDIRRYVRNCTPQVFEILRLIRSDGPLALDQTPHKVLPRCWEGRLRHPPDDLIDFRARRVAPGLDQIADEAIGRIPAQTVPPLGAISSRNVSKAWFTSAGRSCWIQWPQPGRIIVRVSLGT